MYEPNVNTILGRVGSNDVVLDVGGWACPFNRAQWVIDSEPFETRGFYRTFGGAPSQGGEREWFTRDTWIQRDICAREPFPFPDKFFDFVICSHTLEDVRDPVGVCSELVRLGKAGYVEVPSREHESTWGVERPHQAGLCHHRWLIEIHSNEIVFLPKYAMIHSHWRFALPPRYRGRLVPETSVQWLWWRDSFEFRELSIHGVENVEAELERFVERTCPHSRWRFAFEGLYRGIRHLPRQALSTLGLGISRYANKA